MKTAYRPFHLLTVVSIAMCLSYSARCMAQAAATVTTLTLSATTAEAGIPVTVSATVKSGGSPVHPGRVSFCNAAVAHCEDAAILGQAQLTSAGLATVKLRLGIGVHSIQAVFAGTPNGVVKTAGSSSGAQTLTVQQNGLIPSFTYLGSSLTGGTYNFSATVAATGEPSIGGSVNFINPLNGNTSLGTASLIAASRSVLFESAASPSTGVEPTATAVGDFDGDGIIDIAVANFTDQSVTILHGVGDGTFTFKKTIALGISATCIATTDFNNDGKLDLVVGSIQGYAEVLLGQGNGNFIVQPEFGTYKGVFAVTTGDYDGDGNQDYAIISSEGSADGGEVTIWFGGGNGSLREYTQISTNSTLVAITTADFNQDGLQDLAIAESSGPGLILLCNADRGVTQLAGPAGSETLAVAAGDFNGDGIPDLALPVSFDGSEGWVYIYIGNGDGTFKTGPTFMGPYPVPAAQTADLNGDGIADLILQTNFTPTVFLGKGDGSFVATTANLAGSDSSSFSVADLNGDGIPDIALPDSVANNLVIMLGLQTETASITGVSVPPPEVHAIVASYSGDSLYKQSQSAGITGNNVSAPPIIFPDSGAYAEPTKITITDATPGSVIYYTIGSTDTPASGPILYTGPFELSGPPSQASIAEITATATAPGYLVSGPAFNNYEYAKTTVVTLRVNTGPSGPVTGHATLAAYVTANGVAFHEGIVRFCNAAFSACEGSAVLGTVPVGPGGWAVTKVRLGVGVYSIRAEFEGVTHPPADPYIYAPPLTTAASSAPQTLTVTGKARTVTQPVTAVLANGVYSFTSSVAEYGRPAVSGTLTFEDALNGANPISLGSTSLSPAYTVFSLAAPVRSNVGVASSFVARADFNRDGVPDLASANGNAVNILLNNGNGTFTSAASIPLGGPVTFLEAADLNDDGYPDLVVGVAGTSSIEVFLGNADGTFTEKTTLATPADQSFAVITDLNGDGFFDIVTGTSNSNVVTIFYGYGNGFFSKPIGITLPASPVSLVVTDFNNDGVEDFATSNADGTLSVVLSNQDLLPPYNQGFVFEPPIYPGTFGHLVTGDFNNDGIPDLAVPGSDGVNIYLGKGDGTFVLRTTLPLTNVQMLNVADFNGDKVDDIAVTASTREQNEVVVFFGAGDGTFPQANTPLLTVFKVSSEVTDFNVDGIPDLVALDPLGDSIDMIAGTEVTTGAIDNLTLSPGSNVIYAKYSGSSAISESTGPPTTIVDPAP